MASIEVDREVCDGTRYCERVAPDVFRVDDDEKVVALMSEIPEELVAAAEEAEGLCPTAAIRLHAAQAARDRAS